VRNSVGRYSSALMEIPLFWFVVSKISQSYGDILYLSTPDVKKSRYADQLTSFTLELKLEKISVIVTLVV